MQNNQDWKVKYQFYLSLAGINGAFGLIQAGKPMWLGVIILCVILGFWFTLNRR